MQAIETFYDGYRFRSRLEARWAVVFNNLGIKYEYEKEGYMVGVIDPKPYLPDFYLPDTKTWVEVKGDINSIDWRLMADCVEWMSGLPGTDECSGSKAGLLILGGIPTNESTVFPLLQHRCGGRLAFANVSRSGPILVEKEIDYFDSVNVRPDDDWVILSAKILKNQPYHISGVIDDFGNYYTEASRLKNFMLDGVFEAYKKARHARFEHGEVGK